MRILLFLIGVMIGPAQVLAVGSAPVPVRSAITKYLETQPALLSRQFEVEFADWRGKSTDCAQPLEVSTSHSRLRGKVVFRVRCPRPVWSIGVAAKIVLPGEYWVAERFLAAGSVLAEGDILQVTGDLATVPDDVVRSDKQAIGRVLSRAVATGNPVALNALRENTVIKAGERVRIYLQGSGFVVTGEGTALTGAASGETVTLRTRDGQQLQGRAVKPGVVEVRLE